MMAVCKHLVLLIVVIGIPPLPVSAIEDYCSMDTYATNGSYMQFTKEASVHEFAMLGKFKGLHCCAKGYRSIEW